MAPNVGPVVPLDGFGSVGAVLTSPFVLFNCAMNMLASVGMSRIMFWLLFVELGEAVHVPWYSPNLIGVVIGSVVIVSPTLVMALAPAGMPAALAKGWYMRVRVSDVNPTVYKYCPFLWDSCMARTGLGRHLLLGLQLSIVFIPIPILIAYTAYHSGFEIWELVWFDIIYETVLAVPCTLLGLLGFAMEHNIARVEAMLAKAPSSLGNLVEAEIGGLSVEDSRASASPSGERESSRAALSASTASPRPSSLGATVGAVIGSLWGSLQLLL